MFSKGFFDRVIESRDFVAKDQPFPTQVLVFMCLQQKSSENAVGKGEIIHAGFQHFSALSTRFLFASCS